MAVKNREPYEPAYYSPMPTGWTRYIRLSLPWQLYRFLVINWKILKVMARSGTSR